MGDRAPMTPDAGDRTVALALARSRVYRTLAAAFRWPADDAEPLDGLAAAAATAATGLVPPEVGDALATLGAACAGLAVGRRREDLAAAFGHVVDPACPLYEAAADADPFRPPHLLADLVAFYRAWGLELVPEARERADHLAIELEFMQYLAFREAYAATHHGRREAAAVQRAERLFLERHLARWAPAVGRALTTRARGWLAEAGRLLERVLAWEAVTGDPSPAGALAGPPTPGGVAEESR